MVGTGDAKPSLLLPFLSPSHTPFLPLLHLFSPVIPPFSPVVVCCCPKKALAWAKLVGVHTLTLLWLLPMAALGQDHTKHVECVPVRTSSIRKSLLSVTHRPMLLNENKWSLEGLLHHIFYLLIHKKHYVSNRLYIHNYMRKIIQHQWSLVLCGKYNDDKLGISKNGPLFPHLK